MTQPYDVVSSEAFGVQVCEALGIDHERVSRIVIDATAGEPLKVYVEMPSNPQMLQLDFPHVDEMQVSFGEDEL